MPDTHPTNRTLLAILANQVTRTAAAFEDLTQDVYEHQPGGDCNSIRGIGEHLIMLRGFQLKLLESPLEADVPHASSSSSSVANLLTTLGDATRLVESALRDHDPEDWDRPPAHPRSGPWADEPTLARIVRPLNDFTNHLGAIRAIRRVCGSPAERTQ